MAATKKQPEEIRVDDDLKLLSETLDEVLRYTGDQADDAYQELKKGAEKALSEVKKRLGANDGYCARAKKVADKADGYVRDNPWHGIGIGATVGLVLGLLLAKR
ncbi:stress response protein ElaB [Pectobacterium cacticida]|uniref:Stress response protein ElaB n=1 Tax=Pectobacterium cacticida TaxID=69221 RepID=A0ABZ2GDN4_9GAMM|nr:stress response protein ElaB [Pectobacterium cacticida]UYX05655.1 stress response protein ElaB [Pectobacterium cacticida]